MTAQQPVVCLPFVTISRKDVRGGLTPAKTDRAMMSGCLGRHCCWKLALCVSPLELSQQTGSGGINFKRWHPQGPPDSPPGLAVFWKKDPKDAWWQRNEWGVQWRKAAKKRRVSTWGVEGGLKPKSTPALAYPTPPPRPHPSTHL
jgi:hypothetical protein